MKRKLVLILLCALLVPSAPDAGAAQATFPGEPGPIVYRKTFTRVDDKGRYTSGGLFVHDPRLGGVPRQLTADPSDGAPSFSSDGRQIVFEGRTDGGIGYSTGVFVIDRDGAGRKLVVDDAAQPEFFPDSERIVFRRGARIFSVLLDGTGLRQITAPPSPDHEPVVSPDGRKIAFVKTRSGNEAIYVVGSSGGEPRPLIDLPGDDDDPDWAPDGRRVVFTGNRGRCGAGIYVARVDGGGVRRLTPCERPNPHVYNHPAFSPDGRHVVALRHGSGPNAIVLIRSSGGIVGTIDRGRFEEDGVGVDVQYPGWGPRLR